jgi:hypothetical protein
MTRVCTSSAASFNQPAKVNEQLAPDARELAAADRSVGVIGG